MLILCVEKECLVSFGSKLTFILSIEYPFGNIRTQSFENNKCGLYKSQSNVYSGMWHSTHQMEVVDSGLLTNIL